MLLARCQRLASRLPVALLLLCGIVISPFFGAPANGHDTLLHFYRIPAVNALWQAGIPYARWLPDLMLGHGSALFNFYPPLSTYLLTTAYWLAAASAPAALNIVSGAALLLAVVGMYRLGDHLYGPSGGLLAAAAYGLAPHVLYQPLARGSLSNALALGLLPWLVLAIWRAVQRPALRPVVGAALLLALVMLSHIAAGVVLVPVAAALGMAAIWTQPKGPRGRRAGALAAIVLLGMALAAFAWLPALTEIDATWYAAAVAPDKVDFNAHFADIWRWPDRAIAGLNNAPLPKSIGVGQVLLLLAGTVLATYQLVRRRAATGPAAFTLATGGMALAGLFLATPLSGWLWANVALLSNFQFPWRMLDIPAFCAALVVGYLGKSLGQRQPLWLALCLIVFFANAVPWLYPPRRFDLPRQPALADAQTAEQAYGIYGLTAWGEYTASTVPGVPTNRVSGVTLTDRLLTPAALTPAALTPAALTPGDDITKVAASPLRSVLQVNFESATRLTFAQHDFPGWRATVDGQPQRVGVDAAGQISVEVPAGAHEVAVWFGRTAVRQLADGLSAVALLVVAGGVLWPAHSGRQTADAHGANRQPLPQVAVVVLATLLVLKVGWLDHFGSPLLVHPAEAIPGVPPPSAGTFSDALTLVGVQSDGAQRLTLYWRAQRDLAESYAIVVTIEDAAGRPVAEIANNLPGENVTSTWKAGQLTRDSYSLPIDPAFQPAAYRVYVAVRDATGTPLRLRDAPDARVLAATPKVAAPARAAERFPLVTFGDVVALEAAALPPMTQVGRTLTYTLQWRALQSMAVDYTVFVHLLAADGSYVSGNDGQPVDGRYPTSFWERGETIVSDRTWIIDAPPGSYEVRIGLYRLETGERLPVTSDRSSMADSWSLGQITVTAADR